MSNGSCLSLRFFLSELKNIFISANSTKLRSLESLLWIKDAVAPRPVIGCSVLLIPLATVGSGSRLR